MSKRWQSAISIGVKGRISTVGHADVRHSLLRGRDRDAEAVQGQGPIKSWGLKIANRWFDGFREAIALG
jgi:hypothetical protein